MEELSFKVHSSLNDWSVTEEIIKKLSAKYGGNHKLRIEVELSASRMLLQSMAGNSTSCMNEPENT